MRASFDMRPPPPPLPLLLLLLLLLFRNVLGKSLVQGRNIETR